VPCTVDLRAGHVQGRTGDRGLGDHGGHQLPAVRRRRAAGAVLPGRDTEPRLQART